MTKKTYAYICVLQSALWQNNELHIRCANDARLKMLTRVCQRLDVHELPYLMTKQDALTWFERTFSDNVEYSTLFNCRPKIDMQSLRDKILNKHTDIASVLAVLEE